MKDEIQKAKKSPSQTPLLDEVYEQVGFEREIVFKFFTIFSLFEYALKKAGFVIQASKNNDAQPAWDKFVISIEEKFNPKATVELESAVNYMMNEPTRRQVVQEKRLIFSKRNKPEDQKEIIWLSVLVRSVRNNLFHGAKVLYHPSRDSKLIRCSLVILEAWVHCNEDVERELRHAH